VRQTAPTTFPGAFRNTVIGAVTRRLESDARVEPQFTRKGYWMSSKIENIGMYSATIMPPTRPPTVTIISGSIRLVSDSVVCSTSWS
jgi:hypothetical protein